MKPLDSNPIVNISVPKLPVIGMGTKLELVEGEQRIGIDYKNGLELDNYCVLQAVVIKKAN